MQINIRIHEMIVDSTLKDCSDMIDLILRQVRHFAAGAIPELCVELPDDSAAPARAVPDLGTKPPAALAALNLE